MLPDVLVSLGINIPTEPTKGALPNHWLIRGENNIGRLTSNLKMEPHHGEWATFGVFFADNAAALPHRGIYYVLQREDLSSHWLTCPSDEARQRLEEVAQLRHLDLTKVSSGLQAEEELFRNHPIYQMVKGICTVPDPVEIARARLILVKEGLLQTNRLQIPPSLNARIVSFT